MNLGLIQRWLVPIAGQAAILATVSICHAGEDSEAESSAARSTEEAASDRISTRKISESCFAVIRSNGCSNAGFVVGKEAVLVVNCFESPEAGKRLVDEVRRVSDKPIRHVVLTGEAYDHVVGNQAMPEEATIYASKEAGLRLMERLKKDRLLLGPAAGAHKAIGFLKVREPTQAVKGRTEIDLGEVKVTLVVAGEGHGAGDLIAWVQSEKVLYAGNLVWNRCHPNLVGGSTFLWIGSLAAMEKLDIQHVVPGHGEVGDKSLLANQRKYLIGLRTTVKHLARRKVTIDKIVAGVQPAKEYADYEFRVYWPRNLVFVHGELLRNR